MLPTNSDRQWEAYGKADPYFGVLSHERFQAGRLDEAAREEFFASGEAHIAAVFDTIKRTIASDFEPDRCLDFGCGVGRLVVPMAARCSEVVGVDISPSMLNEARANAVQRGLANVGFFASDDELSEVGGNFDFVHSFIVMQHIPRRRGEKILRQLIGRLRPGGVAALHFTYANDLPTGLKVQRWFREHLPLIHNFINLAKGRDFHHPYMMMQDYDLERLMSIIQEGGGSEVHAELTRHGYFRGAMLYFRKRA